MSNIQEIVKALAKEQLGEGFAFRQDQLRCIEQIWNHYLEHPDGLVILDLPTGAGKSIIAIGLSLLFGQQDETGYIVTSDLLLQQQYENDIAKLGLSESHASIKGVDNYQCNVNGLFYSLGDCKNRNMTPAQINDLPCAATCNYLVKRQQAIDSSCAVMNYSYWLIQQNYVSRKLFDNSPFKKRTYTIFDECHKIPEIVQNHFAPRIANAHVKALDELVTFARSFRFKHMQHEQLAIDMSKVTKHVSDLHFEKQVYRTVTHAKRLYESVTPVLAWAKHFRAEIGLQYPENQVIPASITKIYGILDLYKDITCKLQDFLEIQTFTPGTCIKDGDSSASTLYTFSEALLVNKYLLQKSNFKVMMSATVGDVRSFIAAIGASKLADKTLIIKQPSTFHFRNSPIYVGTGVKVTYKTKQTVAPQLVKAIDAIIDINDFQKGIVHTVSYDLMHTLLNKSRHCSRFTFYENTSQKHEAVAIHSETDGSILIGPSLIEGVNLPDELARFQILMKVPFPSLCNKLIAAKARTSSTWYSWKTATDVEQAIGRAIRHPNDEAKTYILDDCFLELMSKVSFPAHIRKRITYLKR